MTEFANEWQREGYSAYNTGLRPTGNPYHPVTEEFPAQQWINGWCWARTDHIIANRDAVRRSKPRLGA